jgi:hypothetical protein
LRIAPSSSPESSVRCALESVELLARLAERGRRPDRTEATVTRDRLGDSLPVEPHGDEDEHVDPMPQRLALDSLHAGRLPVVARESS